MRSNYFPFITISVLLGLAWYSIAQQKDQKLLEANRLYELDYPSEEEEQRAIQLFQEVLRQSPSRDKIREYIQASERLGNLHQSLGETELAKNSYLQGIELQKTFQVSDTLVYDHHLFLGEVYFRLNRIDSSLYFLERAEQIQEQLTSSGQPERLYNALGVYFYETGNFTRAATYFSKAELVLQDDPGEFATFARYSFKSNKASALYKLGQYDSAQQIYRNLLDLGINLDQVRINLANTYLEQNLPNEAEAILNLLSPEFAVSSLSSLNLIAKSLLQQEDWAGLEEKLNQASALVAADSTKRQSFQKGIHYGLWGDFWTQKGNWELALKNYQLGLVQLHPEFENESVNINPENFVLGGSVLSLFDMLSKKAQTSWKAYAENGNEEYLNLGIDTWVKAFNLVRFISGNYENDEARIFLSDQSLRSFQVAVESLVDISVKENRTELLELAFEWSEESKAEGLLTGTWLEAQKRKSGIPETLIQEEQNLLFSISRNYQKQLDGISSEEELQRERIDLQVALSRLREKFKGFSGWDSPELPTFKLKSLQQNLPQNTSVLSLFSTPKSLFVFWVEDDFFDWTEIQKSQIGLEDLAKWVASIQLPGFSGWRNSPELASFSKQILGKFEKRIAESSELIVIPHDQFNGFPFELLEDSQGEILLEKFPIYYQFSSRFIEPVEAIDENHTTQVAFAPFVSSDAAKDRGFRKLPASEIEISVLKGRSWVGNQASKATFIKEVSGKGIIHLATHAVASPSESGQSFVAFYPENEEFRVFEQEISFLDLTGAKLVYLSACETGTGVLSPSEGLVSLARSFALAGAEQMVISQWVSEDRVAAYLAERFYRFLKQGYSPAESLQKAKIELLEDAQMVQFHHPFYWVNFRLVGQPTLPEDSMKNWILLIIVALIGLGLGLGLKGRIHRRREA